jgi:hypothetical protein
MIIPLVVVNIVPHTVLGIRTLNPKVDRQALYLTELKGASLQATYFPCPRKFCPHNSTVFNHTLYITAATKCKFFQRENQQSALNSLLGNAALSCHLKWKM